MNNRRLQAVGESIVSRARAHGIARHMRAMKRPATVSIDELEAMLWRYWYRFAWARQERAR